MFGYYPEATKKWLVVKPAYEERARELFSDVNITTEGRKFLGSFIGSPEAARAFIADKIVEWEKDITALTQIAKYEPQLAYSAYIYGTSRRWQFVCRTTPGISEAMQSLEALIRDQLMPAIMGGHEVSDELRMILNLPARLGGMGFLDPSVEADIEYENSLLVTTQLAYQIYDQKAHFQVDEETQGQIMHDLRKRKEQRWKN